jgi:hypothetical protein
MREALGAQASGEDILRMSSPAPLKDSTTFETSSPSPPKEILTLKPTFMGVGLDLKELFRRAKAWWKTWAVSEWMSDEKNMAGAEPPTDSGKRQPGNKYPPFIAKALLWIAGLAAVMVALTSLSEDGRKLLISASSFSSQLHEIFNTVPGCSGDMTWDERVKCDRDQGR